MKETPILMCAEMVRSLLRTENPKTQTRRIIDIPRLRARIDQTVRSDSILSLCGHKPMVCDPGIYHAKMNPHGATSIVSEDGRELGVKPGEFHWQCPYARGDTHLGNYGKRNNGRDITQWTITPRDSRLWVKETHFDVRPWKSAPLFAAATVDFIYRADYEYREKRGIESSKVIGCHRWKPSIFMRREASRILLDVTQVRVQRVQDISDADALAEGLQEKKGTHGSLFFGVLWEDTAVAAYRGLWNSINGPGSWESNPWVWAVTFRRIQP